MTHALAELSPGSIAPRRGPSRAAQSRISYPSMPMRGSNCSSPDPDARNFVDRGGVVAYGMIPTSATVNTLDPATIFVRWLKAASLADNPQKLAQGVMITAPAGWDCSTLLPLPN